MSGRLRLDLEIDASHATSAWLASMKEHGLPAPGRPFSPVYPCSRRVAQVTSRHAQPLRWPRGVYFCGGEVLRAGIVVASELPRERSTILIRLMAAGRLLPQAMEDLSALPADAHERAVASQILLGLHDVLGKKAKQTREEEEFIVRTLDYVKLYEDKGRLDEARTALRSVLAQRKLAVSRDDMARIDACTDTALLRRWLNQAIVAESAGEALQGARVEGTPARRRRSKNAA